MKLTLHHCEVHRCTNTVLTVYSMVEPAIDTYHFASVVLSAKRLSHRNNFTTTSVIAKVFITPHTSRISCTRLTFDRRQSDIHDFLRGVVRSLLATLGALRHHLRIVMEVLHRVCHDEHEGVHEKKGPSFACTTRYRVINRILPSPAK